MAADAAKFRFLNFAASGLNHLRRRVASVVVVASKSGGGSLLAKFKIQNLAAGSGQILTFAFCGVGFQSSVAIVVFSCKNQNSKFGRGCGQILNFDFCGVGSQSVGRSRRVAVDAVRAARAAAFFLAKIKNQFLAADAAEF